VASLPVIYHSVYCCVPDTVILIIDRKFSLRDSMDTYFILHFMWDLHAISVTILVDDLYQTFSDLERLLNDAWTGLLLYSVHIYVLYL